jgi:hypothetical protein
MWDGLETVLKLAAQSEFRRDISPTITGQVHDGGTVVGWGIYCVAARNIVLVRYSTIEYTEEKSWSRKFKG